MGSTHFASFVAHDVTTAGAMAAITGPPPTAAKSAMAGRSARYSPCDSFGFLLAEAENDVRFK